VFWAREAGARPAERPSAALAWSGAARPRHWSEPAREVDLPDASGAVERVLHGLRPAIPIEPRPGCPAAFHPGRSATWRLADGTVVARAGALHPTLQREHEHPIWLAEIDLDALTAVPARLVRASAVPRLSIVSRDLSLRVPRRLWFEEIARALRAVPAPASAEFEVIDRYAGPPLADDEVSLTVRVCLSPDERTLVDAEIETYRLALVGALEALDGVRLRDT
jgi:phenylalanyl-tRNA synthetase beta chain